ncbi:GDP-mannose 4,6-dehydratase [Bosea massiliensis]|uniref:GDP-mannose 4,6-dehydratase n=1 Tax=Bosea massiliensis TaxID=151419 RepID=A0ABW0P5N5_9HYPH
MQIDQSAALIIGVSGQDGAYLADLLLARGLSVHGSSRDKESASFASLKAMGIFEGVRLHSVAPDDFRSVAAILKAVRPRYIFNLAAQSSVGLSFEQPVETIDSIMHATITIMEAVRFLGLDSRIYNASSSECFGNTNDKPADETTSFSPRSPYAVGKAAAFWAVANYREAYGLFTCSGILFNHESPMRPKRYVTQKIVHGVLDIRDRKTDILELGSLDMSRDWGWAPEYVDAMWRMVDRDVPEDFVIATGETHSLQDFVAAAFSAVGLDWREHVRISDAFRRPTDIIISRANPDKAKRLLGWTAETRMFDVVEKLLAAESARRAAAR